MAGGQLLVDSEIPGVAGLGLERRISGVAGVKAKSLVEAGLLDSLAVEATHASISPKTLAITEGQRRANSGDDAGTEIGVGFGSRAEIDGNARMRPDAKIEEAALIVAADVRGAQEGKVDVFDFVLIAGGDAELGQEIAGLSAKAGAVIFQGVGKREIAGEGGNRCGRQRRAEGIAGVEEIGEMVVDEFAIVRFDAADGVVPVPSGSEIPARVSREKVQRIAFIEIWGKKQRLARITAIAIGVAQREAELIGVAETPAEVIGKDAVEKTIIGALARGLEVGGSRGRAGGAAMREGLNHTGNGVGTVECAFRAADDFDFVDIVEGKVGEIEC